MDVKKMANNILEFLIDPTVIPVERRLYIGPEEKLDNSYYEKAKAKSFEAYRDQKHNSDMYPERNRKLTRMGGFKMDRRTFIASLDILAQKFASEKDPIATDLRTMAFAISEMSDDEYGLRVALETAEGTDKTANAWMDHLKKIRDENPGKSLKELIGIAKKTYKKEASETDEGIVIEDPWTKEASDAVAQAIIGDVIGTICEKKEKEEVDAKVKCVNDDTANVDAGKAEKSVKRKKRLFLLLKQQNV